MLFLPGEKRKVRKTDGLVERDEAPDCCFSRNALGRGILIILLRAALLERKARSQRREKMILRQVCSQEYLEAQNAFKGSMIHGILQFTLLIAVRCVLHRCE